MQPRTKVAMLRAIKSIVEILEPRRLLSITPAALAAALPSGVDATLSADGAAEISLAPSSDGVSQSTPNYIELDSDPRVAGGALEPFSTAAPTGYLPSVVRHAYGVDQIMFGAIQGDGTGQTIAIIDAYDYPTASTDLHAFDLAAGLPDPPSLTRVNETGGTALPGDDPAGKGDDWEVEESLDVEWSHAMAPGASIVLIETNSATDADLIDAAVAYARSAPGVDAVTMSFGRSENSTDASLDPLFTTPSGHAGVTFLASTGDSAAPGEYPAYSPNVVAVGGTTLNANASGGYLSETGWADGGGGISSYETQPAFQNGVVTQSTTERAIPDVSSDADPNTGVAIYDSYDFGTVDPWLDVGGTSVASPSWAGMIAIADQGRTLGGGGSLDGPTQTLPKLYSMPAANFHDITSGNNGYAAGPGYDLVTGRGSPVANTLISLLAAAGPFVTTAAPTGIQITAPTSFVFNFSGAMNTSSFSIAGGVDSFTGPGDVNLLSSITGYSWTNSTTLNVNFTAPTAQGAYTMVIGPNILSSGGVAMDQNQDGVPGEVPADEYSGKFNFDSNPLKVASTTPPAGGVLTGPSATLSVNFNQPINPATAAVSNLNVSQGTVSAVSVLSGNTTVQYTISGLTSDGSLTAAIAAGALNDANGNPLYQASTGSYIVDIPTAALPVPFVSALPQGSLIYTDPGLSDAIQFAGDSHSYTVSLNANQTLTLTLTGAAGLLPSVQVTNPAAVVVGSVTGPGSSVVLETVPVATAGVYTITVTGSNNSTGSYALGATLNAAVNADTFTGATNQTLGSAQDLTGSFLSLGGGASRGAVSGKPLTGSSSLQDYYSFALNAGDSVTLTVKATGVGTDNLTLLNSSGGVLATGVSGATNVDQAITSFSAPASGTYYALISAASGATSYNMVVVRNAVFSLQPHATFATAQSLSGTYGALGDLSSTTTSGSVIVPSTLANTPGDSGNYFPFANAQMRYQQIYSASQFTSGGLITAIDFRRYISQADFSETETSIRIDLAYAATTVATASGTFASNVGANDTIVFQGTLNLSSTSLSASPNPFDIVIPLSTGFNYNPALGDLLMDIRLTQGPGSSATFLDAADSSQQSVTTRIWADANVNATTGTVGFSGSSDYGLITNFNFSTGSSNQDWYSVNVTNTSSVLAFSTATPGGTTGQFANTLDPHVEIFDPNGNLVATGTKLADGRNESITYQPLMTGAYRIEVLSQNSSSGEYVLQAGNALQLGLPANVTQGQGTVTGTLNASTAPTSNLTVTLTSSDPSRLTVPSTIVLPAGQTSISLPITAVTNTLLEGPEAITITASGGTYFSASAVVTIHDTKTAVLSVSLPTTAYKNGGTVTGTITCSAAPAENVTIALASSLNSSLTVPATVTLLAGQTTATFTATVVNNTVITGNQSVNVSASVENWTTGTATINILETNNNISLALPVSGWEGQTLTNASVTLGGTVTSPLVITLTSNDPAELSVPATVTIPAGSSSVYFNVTLINDGIKFGSHSLNVSAAGTGLNSPGPTSMLVYDSNLDHLGFTTITGPETAGASFNTLVDAYNIANLVIAVYNATGTLTAAGHAGAVPVSPSSVTFSSGAWTGPVVLTKADPSTSLTVTTGGLSVTSNTFAVQGGAESNLSWGAITGTEIANVPFAETITATDAYGNPASNFNGTVTLSGLVGATVSSNLLGTANSYPDLGSAAYTWGYSFTPNTNFQVTAVRSYFGSNVSIWNSSETLLASQAITATPGTWTLTNLSTPLQLVAGTTYYVGAYTTSTYYYGTTVPVNPSFATIGTTVYYPGSGFPIYTDSGIYFAVDLQGNVGAYTTVPITPTTATFTNGVWTGSIDVTQAATGMHLHAVDSSNHTADSSNFTVIVQTLSLNLPTDAEETDGTDYGVLQISPAPTTNLTVTLGSSDSTRLTVPATIAVLAGQTSVTVPLTLINANSLDALESVTVTASANTYSTGTAAVRVHSSQTAVLSVSLASSVTKGGTVIGTVTSSAAPSQNITINLSSSNNSRATVPATITLPAGQTTATFTLAAVQDTVIDGTQLVTVAAAVDDWTTGYKSIAILDDNDYISVVLPTGGFEGQTFTNGGIVKLGGSLTSAMTVNLSSNDTSQVSIPTSITIPAGATSATFNVTLVNNGIKGLSQTASISATAAGFASNGSSMVVHDSNLDHLGFATSITGPENAGTPFTVTVDALNLAGEVIPVYTGLGALTATGHAGGVPVSPTSANFSAGVWTSNVTLTLADPSTSLTLSSGGLTISTGSFIVQPGAIAKLTWGAVSTPQTAGVPFSETVTATDAYGNLETGFNGSAGLSGLIGSSTTTTIENSAVYTGDYSGVYTHGYTFTPNTNVTVTAVRSFFGTQVSIWNTSNGALLASQAVPGPDGAWAETPLTTPIALYAGVSYTIGTYTNGGVNYYRTDVQSFSWGTVGEGVFSGTNSFPNSVSGETYWLVDLRATIGTYTTQPITPTTATFTNGVWTGNVTVTQPGAGMHLHADDGLGQTGDSATFTVLPAAPAPPALSPASDTGVSSTDGITNLNNSAGKTLSFTINNTVAGATITLYANETAIGTAVATATSTVITTNGTTALADGSVSFTARQTISSLQSVDSTPDLVTIKTIAPATPPAPVLESASDSGVSNTDGITNVTTPKFDLTGAPYYQFYENSVLISPTYGTGTSFTVPALANGTYNFSYAAVDAAGNVSAQGPVKTVTIDTTPPTASLAAVSPQPSTPVNSDLLTFSEPVAGLTLADLSLTLNGGPNLLNGSETLTSTDNTNWNISNLAQFTGTGGAYTLALSQTGITDIAGNSLAAGTGVSWTAQQQGSPAPLVLNGSAGNTSFYLNLDQSGSNLQVWQLPQGSSPSIPLSPPTFTYPVGSVSAIVVNGGGAQDVSLTVDESNGTIETPGGLSFSGGAGATGDSLTVVLPASGGAASVSATTVSPASSPTAAITYSQLGSITIDGSTGNDTVIQTAQPGAPLTFNGGAGSDTLTVNGGTFTFSGNPALFTASLTLNDNSQVDFTAGAAGTGIQLVDLASLNIGPAAVAQFADALSHSDRSLLIASGLSIAPTGKLDLGFNDAILPAGTLTAVNGYLTTGYNNGTWNGPGIESSAAASDTTRLKALGVIANNNGNGAPLYGNAGSLGNFDGQSPAVNQVLVKFTYYGDANLNGHVDGGDYSRIDNAYISPVTGWFNGDFNYDGAVDGSDYTLIDNTYNTQGAGLSAQVATPAAQIASPAAQMRPQKKAAPSRSNTLPNNWQNVFSTATPLGPTAGTSNAIDLLIQQQDLLDNLHLF